MKIHNLFILAFLLLSAQSAFAQNKVETVTLNFDTKTFNDIEKLDNLNKGDYYQLVIDCINTNLYSVAINHNDCTLTNAMPSPALSLLGIGDLPSLVSSIATSNFVTTVEETVSEDKKNKLYHDSIKFMEFLDSVPSLTAEEKKLMAMKNKGFQIADKLLPIGKTVNDLYVNVNLYQACALQETLDTACKNLKVDYNTVISTIKTSRDYIAEHKKAVSNLKTEHATFYEENKTTIDNDTNLKKLNGVIVSSITKLEEIVDKISKKTTPEELNKLVSAVVMIANTENRTYKSLPLQFNGDLGSLSITISPRNKELPLNTYNTKLHFPSKKCWFGGVGTSFYASGLYDEAYSTVETKQTDTTSIFNIVDEKPAKFEMGMAVLLRFGGRIPQHSELGINITLGPGISLSQEIRPRLLLGGGLAYGKRHMLVVDGGFIMGYTDVLSEAVSTDQTYEVKPNSPVVSKLNVSGFGSVGYMFSF